VRSLDNPMRQMDIAPTTRFWGATTMLLCALLWQNCQSNSLRAVEEKRPEETPLESGWPPPASETLTQPIDCFPSPPPTTAMYQPKVLLTVPPLPLLPGFSLSTAFADTPLSVSVHPTASTTPSRNLLVAPDRLPLAAMPRASHAAPLRNTPNGTSSSVFTAAFGERVRFSQVEGQWRATLQRNDGSSASQRTFPAVGPADVGSFLSWLQGQDRGTLRARVHLLKQMPQAPYGPCVYLGEVGLLGGLPDDEEEDAKPPAKRPLPHLEGALAESNKKTCTVEECVRRTILNILLDVAKLAPDKAAEFLEVLLVAAKDKGFRQNSLEALGKVAQATPGRVSQCLSSLRAAAKDEDKDVRLLALKTLGALEWKHYFGDVGSIPNLPSNIDAVLDGPCPFWPGKKVRDTHLLVLIPARVDGAPFTLNLLGALIQHPKNGEHKTKYRCYDGDVKTQLGKKSPDRSYWLLMTREVLKGSRGKSYADQNGLVAQCAEKTQQPYELPGVLEAAAAILLHHARTGERLLENNPLTYTRCREWVAYRGASYPAIVGGFESSGLIVSGSSIYGYYSNGVVCSRRFAE
jgi:hypothetical protein